MIPKIIFLEAQESIPWAGYLLPFHAQVSRVLTDLFFSLPGNGKKDPGRAKDPQVNRGFLRFSHENSCCIKPRIHFPHAGNLEVWQDFLSLSLLSRGNPALLLAVRYEAGTGGYIFRNSAIIQFQRACGNNIFLSLSMEKDAAWPDLTNYWSNVVSVNYWHAQNSLLKTGKRILLSLLTLSFLAVRKRTGHQL